MEMVWPKWVGEVPMAVGFGEPFFSVRCGGSLLGPDACSVSTI